MRNIAAVFRDYARLDLKRIGAGLSVPEFEHWNRLKTTLDHELRSRDRAARDDRRSSPRIATRLRCSYADCDELRRASVTNLATGGVFISTTAPAPLGTRLQLRIQIEESGAEIEVPGVVVSTNFAPGQPRQRGMGVRFDTVTPEMIEEISRLYAREAEREAREACPEAAAAEPGDEARAGV